MLLSTLSSRLSHLVFADECLTFEKISLSDELTTSGRLGSISITSNLALSGQSTSMLFRGFGLAVYTSELSLGLSGATPTTLRANSSIFLTRDLSYAVGTNVGAVLSYTRQPKHVRKNTGGRDWLRVTLRVRELRSFRGLL
jgi:hypothetical protein